MVKIFSKRECQIAEKSFPSESLQVSTPRYWTTFLLIESDQSPLLLCLGMSYGVEITLTAHTGSASPDNSGMGLPDSYGL